MRLPCALGITSAYVFGVTLLSRYTRQKKHLAKLDEMIAELKNMQNELL